ncbi:MAG: GNAT family N-acetyltransferase, partial [Ilumatobacteraceae bacterium]
MLPLLTPRLTLRVMQPADAPLLAAYRNDPVVAEMQGWAQPYTQQMADAALAEQAGWVQPQPKGWTQLAIDHEGAMMGDLALHHKGDGIAEIGWTLTPAAQGQGFATEAAAALCAALFASGIHRIEAMLHPDNLASARVCEAIGMEYESLTRLTYPGRNGPEDDAHYAMCRDQWDAWVGRPRHAPTEVQLVPMNDEIVDDFHGVATHHSQQRFVRPVLFALAQMAFPIFRDDGQQFVPEAFGVTADGEPVGFVQLTNCSFAHDEPYLWRLLIDRRHQRRSLGRSVLDLLTDQLRRQGHTALMT